MFLTTSDWFFVGDAFSTNAISASPYSAARAAAFSTPSLAAAPIDSDFEKPLPVSDKQKVDANKYNIPVEEASELWTASVQETKNALREAGVPYLDSKSKDYFVDDIISIQLSRQGGGLGLELLEIAGGRVDGIGITIVSGVTKGGNAEQAGILPGDSIVGVTVFDTTISSGSTSSSSGSAASSGQGIVEETKSRQIGCECRDFDSTIDALTFFPVEDYDTLVLDIKRIRRWPKIQVKVEYPPSQCAEGVDNVKELELFGGENLKRALLTRGIVMDDPGQPKCDYCGSNACYVRIYRGKDLLNPMGTTEEKLMKRNPGVRLSCKTTVGYNMQEGELGMQVNLSQWNTDKPLK